MQSLALKVLLIEDDPEDVMLIRDMLTESAAAVRFHVKDANSLAEGIGQALADAPDITLLDMNLPDSSGIETLTTVLERIPGTPVVVLTGLGDEMLASQAVRMGAQDYLNKGGLSENLLTRSLSYAIERHQLLHELEEKRQKERYQLEKHAQQLQAQISELEAFSYGIAHDLRSPLLSVEGFSRLLREDMQNNHADRVQEDIRLLESGIKKMHNFLNRTLEYSRAGYMVKQTENVAFGEIVDEVIKEFDQQMNSIGAVVSRAETFPTVRADRMRVVQVLTNLIQNSINYRDETVPLKIEIGHNLLENEDVFSVRDNGAGIDEIETEKVFSLFYRGTSEGEGSGVGLAIVKKIVEAHGGRIWIEQTSSAKGTSMCFTLSGISKSNNNPQSVKM